MHDTSSEGASSRSTAGSAVLTTQVVKGRGTVTFLRIVATLCFLQTLVQGLLAGMLLNGDLDSIDPHGTNAYVFEALVFLQLVGAVLLWRQNRELKWPLAAGIGILAITFIQVTLGLESALAAHVTLGVLMCAMETAFILRTLMLRVEDAPAAA